MTGRSCHICHATPRWHLSRTRNTDPTAACADHLTPVIDAWLTGPHEWGTVEVTRAVTSILADRPETYTVDAS